MKHLLQISCLVFFSSIFSGCAMVEEFQSSSLQTVKWTTFEKVAKKKTKKKKIMVDLYTSWCGWCKRMDKNTFSDPEIAAYLNKKFYTVKFNAEDKSSIYFDGKTYIFDEEVTAKGRHQLASMLLETKEKVGYPTIVFLDEEMNIIQNIQGYKDIEDFTEIMKHFGEETYKTEKRVF